MKSSRRGFLHLTVCVAALPAVSRIAQAQRYPTRPIRLIVGYAPGGVVDIVARLIGQRLSDRLGQQIVVENHPGAGTNIATGAVAHASPDGYTLLMATGASAINATLYQRLTFNFVRDLAPVASIAVLPQIMEVNSSLPATTIPEFIAYAKANPGKMNFASGGVGSTPHVSGELFNMAAGVHMQHVAYRGMPPALADMIGGRVQMIFTFIPESIEYVRAGKLRALAVTTAQRLDVLEDIPTVGEFLSGFEATSMLGVCAPNGTPAAIVDKLNGEINTVLADPQIKAQLAMWGFRLASGSPADFANTIAKETEKWAKVIKFAGIKLE